MRLLRLSAAAPIALACLFAGVCLTGCTTPQLIVQDDSGKPVPGARVTVGCGSTKYPQDATGPDGSVSFPQDYPQPPRWVEVDKDGYVPIFMAYPTKWPCVLGIRRHWPAATVPAPHR